MLKKKATTKTCSCKFYKIFKNIFFTEYFWATAFDCNLEKPNDKNQQQITNTQTTNINF